MAGSVSQQSKHVRALQAFLTNENNFFNHIKTLVEHSHYFANILPDYGYFQQFIKPLQSFVDAGNFFSAMGAPEDINEDNFMGRVTLLHNIICLSDRFAIKSIPGFATLAINYGGYVSYLNEHKEDINRQSQIKLTVEQKKFFKDNNLPPSTFLGNFLIKPIQRIAQYPLQLTDIFRALPQGHDAFEKMQAIAQEAERLGKQANTVKRTPKEFRQLPSGLLNSPITPKKTQKKFKQARFDSGVLQAPDNTEAKPEKDQSSQALPLIANLLRLIHYYTNGPMAKEMINSTYEERRPIPRVKSSSSSLKKLLLQFEKDLLKLYFCKDGNIAGDIQRINGIIDAYDNKLRKNITSEAGKKMRATLSYLKTIHNGNLEAVSEPIFPLVLFDFNSNELQANNFIQKSFLGRLLAPVMSYSKKVRWSFWRRVITTDPDKLKAKNRIINQLTSLMKLSIEQRSKDHPNLWDSAITLFKKHTFSGGKFQKKYARNAFGYAYKQVESYLQEVGADDQNVRSLLRS